MADDRTDAAGDIRLRGEEEAGPASGVRDLAGLAISAGLLVLAYVISNDAADYPIRQSYAQFGPEIVPYIVAAGIAVMALITGLIAWRGGFEARERLNGVGLFWVVVAICVQIAMLYGGAGFILASTALFALTALAFGQTTTLLNIVIGAVLAFVLYLVFRYGLGLSLPSGPIENVIGLVLG